MKKLILKRSLLFTVSITVFIKQVLIPNIIIYAEEDSINGKQPYSFTDHLAVNNQLFSYYIELIDANCNTVPQTNPIPQDMAITDYQNLYDNFYGLLLIDIDSSEFEIISNEETDYISSYILYDATTSVYSYVEVNHLNEENMLLCINSYVYMIELKDDNLTILNEKGNKLDLITTFKENDGISEKLKIDNSSMIDSKNRSGYWINYLSGAHKTTNAYVYVLQCIEQITGTLYEIHASHSIFGVISWTATLAITVGSYIFITLYITYSQYYISDCYSYIRESGVSYTDYYDSGNSPNYYNYYYHSVNPYEAGQNCLAYS